jgi:hypothetical protein
MEQQNTGIIQTRPQVKKVSKPFYLWSYLGSYIGTLIVTIIAVIAVIAIAVTMSTADQSKWETWLGIFGIIAIPVVLIIAMTVYMTVIIYLLLYKSWQAIQDGHQRTTPGKAVGFSFIPYFNLYWIFQAYWGFAKDYNAFLDRNSLSSERLSTNLFLTYCILTVACMVPGISSLAGIATIVFGAMVINQQCKAINNLANVN